MKLFARIIASGCLARHSSKLARGGRLAFVLITLAAGFACQGQVFQDYFTNRQSLTTTNGTLLGTNTTATIEANEPRHGGKAPSHSIWISWVAPQDGVATFDTHGSSFDTLLSAYLLSPTNSTSLADLNEESEDDDDPGFEPTSLIQFGAIAGRTYEIAVDGYDGDTGVVQLNWSFAPAAFPPPIISSIPPDQAAKQGDTVVLSVNMTTSPDLSLDWYFNNGEDSIQTGTNCIIASLQSTNVGRYKLRVTVGHGNNRVRFFTDPIEVQINTDGITNALARDKLFDALGTPLLGSDGNSFGGNLVAPAKGASPAAITSATGVASGYIGSQVFNTTFATVDPAEPPHCGVTGGSSYWLIYQPPTNGVITLDTIGSQYDTVMEVFTYNGTLTSYANLISLGCDNDSIAFHGAARVSFQVNKARRYVIAVDGVNGARGIAQLNYTLSTNLPATPPILQSLISTQTVAVGANALLAPPITGCPPMKYGWKKNTVTLVGSNAASLLLAKVVTTNTGNYQISVTNDFGVLSATVPLYVVDPPACALARSTNLLNLSVPTVSGLLYTIEQTTNLAGPWSPWSASFFGSGELFTTNILGPGSRFFRVRVE